jgi:hypothetical protein
MCNSFASDLTGLSVLLHIDMADTVIDWRLVCSNESIAGGFRPLGFDRALAKAHYFFAWPALRLTGALLSADGRAFSRVEA